MSAQRIAREAKLCIARTSTMSPGRTCGGTTMNIAHIILRKIVADNQIVWFTEVSLVYPIVSTR
jgi:hypothetical protein